MPRPGPKPLNSLHVQTGTVAFNIIGAAAVYGDDFDKLADFLEENCANHAPGSEDALWHDRSAEMFRACARFARDNRGLLDYFLSNPTVAPKKFIEERENAALLAKAEDEVGVMLDFLTRARRN